MADIFISLPTQHGEAKLILEKAKLSVILPTSKETCRLYYDGVDVDVLMSSNDLARFLGNDPLFFYDQVKQNWLGVVQDDVACKTFCFHDFANWNSGNPDHFLSQFARLDAFQTPFFNKETGKLTTKVHLSAFMIGYQQYPFDEYGYKHKNRNDFITSKTGTASIEMTFLMPANTRVTEAKIINAFKKACIDKAKAVSKSHQYNLMTDSPTAEQRFCFYGKSNDYFVISPEFPAASAIISEAEYSSRLNDLGFQVQAQFEQHLANLHAQSRIAAAEHIGYAIIAAGYSINKGLVDGAYIMGSSVGGAINGLSAQSRSNTRMALGNPSPECL